ncbi:MAG: bifunctional riboflavin kinase/FAD synthetase [Thermodesulfovibrio sp.]|uniref:bifunctional riboflavin kinase/FAD synthetase n=1 Tax=unclassified Thermodesulfovibrio TaxID=2645936 RepID=UPI00083B82F9|nr:MULTISPECIES: bifunctional riboflavin kinase/FAD synthetase [unclassified Thermodesulfovibrio]MDI1472759.1 bifunctional riboflavin kinase/FAD synthetase [Thermodesulfovibrio sp. 1176]MDI6713458.1 bifunctional riboflavin kinase/FAD synthetase [Thermodesulfovibrio sp.]ODA44497.1 Riboflavin kinase [Thermodesulfovibrio sp. N1]
MQVIREVKKIEHANTVITIGNFDGVHLGHQKLFDFVKRKAKQISGKSIVVTFNPHPIKVLFKEHPLKLITTVEDKIKLIEKCGIDITICIPFTLEFAQIEAEDFVSKILLDKFNAKWIIVGYDYRFGKNRRGDREMLKKLSEFYGFKVTVVKAYKKRGKILSSTAVRNALMEGNIKEANLFLGRAYHIDGEVIKGAGRGSSILGYPTANILPKQEIIPKEGVYAVKVTIKDGLTFKGVANIGKNPTFGNTNLSYEVHILDFKEDLLGKIIRVHFIERLRDEKKFTSSEELKNRIAQDIEFARKIFRKDKTKLFLDF